MTRAEIRTRILEALNESTTAPTFWTLAEVNAIIEEGQEILAEELRQVKRTALVTLRAGALYYHTQSIAPDVMSIYRLWLTNRDERLEPVTMAELDARHELWPTVSGTSEPWCWFPVGYDLFGIWPAISQAGGVLHADYIAWPREMNDDADEPEFMRADHDTLVLYGIYDGLVKRWDLELAAVYFSRFIERIQPGKNRGKMELGAPAFGRSASWGGYRGSTGIRR